jgi:hypothetical protein
MNRAATPRHAIRRRTERILIDGRLDEPDWQAAEPLAIDNFLECAGNRDVRTTVRLLWDEWNLYLAFASRDRNIRAKVTDHNGMVWEDTCVEFFVAPDLEKPDNYYTWEINCVGATLNAARCDFWKGEPGTWRPTDAIATSIKGPTKEPSPDDVEWFCEVAIPFANFVDSAIRIPPKPGDVWRANFQQCAGWGSHLATWSPLPSDCKTFHTPSAFGKLIFTHEPVR